LVWGAAWTFERSKSRRAGPFTTDFPHLGRLLRRIPDRETGAARTG
jgi:hypothetical protein